MTADSKTTAIAGHSVAKKNYFQNWIQAEKKILNL